MIVPSTLTLAEIQQSIREIHEALKPLQDGVIDLNGGRVVNAGKAVQPFDYVRKADLRHAMTTIVTASKESFGRTLLTANRRIRVGAFATRGAAVPRQFELFIASDRDYAGWVSTGAVWKFVFGVYTIAQSGLSAIAATLGTDDVGFLVNVSDYSHLLKWTGSAWTWAPEDDGSGYVQPFLSAPTGFGASAWQVCDGSTVNRLNADGTVTSVTVPDYTTAAYLKLIDSGNTVGPTAADGLTAATTATNQTATTGVTVDAHTVKEIDTIAEGSGDFIFEAEADAAHTVQDGGHTHTQNAHTHGPGTLELHRTELLAYYRR